MRAISLPVAVSVLLSACASNIEIQTDYNRNADFAALETFTWQDTAVSSTGAYD
ncbi:MAG: DUF4136 domain-containing protein, partial [Gammaproteobacteria bacterium]|nr:DUF4136 domain-containing protein [Gammaproteobacteria bacterium]